MDRMKKEKKEKRSILPGVIIAVSYTHLRAHETRHDLVCRLLLEKKQYNTAVTYQQHLTQY